MKKSKTVLKTYFQTGDKPTQDQFEDLIDSLVHQDDETKIYISNLKTDTKGNVTVNLSNGGELSIQKPVTQTNQDNKIRVVDLGDVLYNSGPFLGGDGIIGGRLPVEGLRQERLGEPILIGDQFPIIGNGVESFLAEAVNKLNPPITIEEDEIVIFEYNLVEPIES